MDTVKYKNTCTTLFKFRNWLQNKCSLHVSGEVHHVCKMLTQEWYWIIIVGLVNLASWKDGDPCFFSPLFSQWRRSCGRPCPPRLYSAAQMWIFRNSSSLNQEQPSTSPPPPSTSTPTEEKKNSGMGMNSSNVDKRTRLIPCRCACELREGALRCPRSREKGTSPWRKCSELRGENSSEAQYSWFWPSAEEEGEGRQPKNALFPLTGGTVGMQNTWAPQCKRKSTITVVLFEGHL